MNTFSQTCQDYHLAKSALRAHLDSAQALEIGCGQVRHKFQLYLDLTHWPDNPDLRRLDALQVAELVGWGESFKVRLDAYHDERKALRSRLDKCLFDALKALGIEMAHVFAVLPGPVCGRLKIVLSRASSMRQTMLDGICYVSQYDTEGSQFLPSFLRATKLSKQDLRQALLAQS